MREVMQTAMHRVSAALMRVTVNIPEDIGIAAEEAAGKKGQSVSAFYSTAVKFYLRELRRERAAAELNDLIDHMEPAPDAVEDFQAHRSSDDRL